MAEQRRNGSGRDGARRNGSLSARDAVERVREDVPALLSRSIESALGVERDCEDEPCRGILQVVEPEWLPGSTGGQAVQRARDGGVR